jgi:small subunit ribosomal protein S6
MSSPTGPPATRSRSRVYVSGDATSTAAAPAAPATSQSSRFIASTSRASPPAQLYSRAEPSSFLLRARRRPPDRGATRGPGLPSPEEVIRINPYEIMLLIEPEVAEERHGEIIDRVKQIVEKGDGTWISSDTWGRRKLAYEIKHQGEAFYYVLTFDAPAPALHEVTRVLAITDGVMRFMAVNRLPGSSAKVPDDTPQTSDEQFEEPVEAGA